MFSRVFIGLPANGYRLLARQTCSTSNLCCTGFCQVVKSFSTSRVRFVYFGRKNDVKRTLSDNDGHFAVKRPTIC